MSDPRATLQEALGRTPMPELRALSDEQVAHLAAAITQAREHQLAALGQAMEDGLGFVPRLLRGPVRKALFG